MLGLDRTQATEDGIVDGVWAVWQRHGDCDAVGRSKLECDVVGGHGAPV